jgi:hypothetical protein
MGVGRMVAIVAMSTAVLGPAAPAWSQTPPIRVELHGRMHYQWNTTSVDPDETTSGLAIAPSTFEHRRVRLSAEVRVSDWIRGRIEPEMSMGGSIRLRNAWVALALTDAVTIRAGQFKKPFNLLYLTSGSDVPVIERTARIRGLENALVRSAPEGTLQTFRGELMIGEEHALLENHRYTAYDMGLAVEGRYRGLGLNAGVFNGNGPDVRDENAGVSAAAWLTWSTDPGLPATLGGGWSRRVVNWPLPVSLETRTGNAFVADVELGGYRRGVWLMAEAVMGDNMQTEERLRGAHAMLTWYRPTGRPRVEGVEPAVRVSWGDPDDTVEGDDGVLLTPGLNLYFAGRNRLMLNWDVYMPRGEGMRTQNAVRAQINLEF